MTGPLDARIYLQRDGFTLDVALRIEPGRTAALLGPNGAGKSTTVSALAGLTPIDHGRIALGERVVDDPAQGVHLPPEQRHIGVVFQDYLLFPHMTAVDNVSFGLRSSGVDRDEARRRSLAWLQALDLSAHAHERPTELSGGQAQRVALARALVIEPELLLLDEPLAALDVTTRAALRRSLATHLSSVAAPRLVITHDPTEAFLLADSVHVLEGGVVTQVGDPDEIRLRPRTPYVADLAGVNLFRGHGVEEGIEVEGHLIRVADQPPPGRVLVTIHPRAVAVHSERPSGSPRNTWEAEVSLVEAAGDRVRVQVNEPLPLTAEITRDAHQSLRIRPGGRIWLAIKATEIGVEPDS